MADSLDEAREKRAGLRAAMGRVERLLARPAGERTAAWGKDLRDGLEELSAALELHIEVTEAPGGLLDDVMSVQPRLAHKVQQAKREHRRLRELVAGALVKIPGDAPGEHVDEARHASLEVLALLVRHRHVGADLVYSAYSVDIEAAD